MTARPQHDFSSSARPGAMGRGVFVITPQAGDIAEVNDIRHKVAQNIESMHGYFWAPPTLDRALKKVTALLFFEEGVVLQENFRRRIKIESPPVADQAVVDVLKRLERSGKAVRQYIMMPGGFVLPTGNLRSTEDNISARDVMVSDLKSLAGEMNEPFEVASAVPAGVNVKCTEDFAWSANYHLRGKGGIGKAYLIGEEKRGLLPQHNGPWPKMTGPQ